MVFRFDQFRSFTTRKICTKTTLDFSTLFCRILRNSDGVPSHLSLGTSLFYIIEFLFSLSILSSSTTNTLKESKTYKLWSEPNPMKNSIHISYSSCNLSLSLKLRILAPERFKIHQVKQKQTFLLLKAVQFICRFRS